jgi:probable HAF family extracellular repeat protein
VGLGTRPGQPDEQLTTIWSADSNATLLGFIGDVGAVNNEQQVTGTARMDDGSVHAVRWSGATGTDLGCYIGKDSGGTSINTSGLVAGRVCVHPEDRGQANFLW